MPTYNQAKFLPDALQALGGQTFDDFELVVCNDGSADETAAILKDIRTVTHAENRGTAEAINSAARLATGELMTWISSDNLMDARWLETLFKRLTDKPCLAAVYSGYAVVEGESRHEVRQGEYDPSELLRSENCYFGPSFLIRREYWQEHRGGSSHDYDNWARIEESGPIEYVDELLCEYRRGDWTTCRRRPDLYDADHWRSEAMARRR